VTATMHHGDAYTWLRTLPDAHADAVITDPPYNSGGTTASERRRQTARQKYTSGRAGDLVRELESFDGDNRDQRGYLAWLTLVLTEARRVTVPGGSLLVATDWRQLPVTTDAVQAGGWIWAGIVTWVKPRHRSRPRRGGFWNQTEHYAWGTAGPLRTDHDVYLSGAIEAAAPGAEQRQHPTEKPPALMRELVQIAPPGGLILDPFAGAGGCGAAAVQAGRRFAGCELSEHYHRVTTERLAAAQLQPSATTAAQPALDFGAAS
jgi:site-specific DNA-methyltransferase (adenine-specific)